MVVLTVPLLVLVLCARTGLRRGDIEVVTEGAFSFIIGVCAKTWSSLYICAAMFACVLRPGCSFCKKRLESSQ